MPATNAKPPGRIARLVPRLVRHQSSESSAPRPRRRRRALTAVAVACAASAAAVSIVSSSASSSIGGPAFAGPVSNNQGRHGPPSQDGLGIQPGKIKHVWLIILENKSYDATFTGLNKNTYLWQDLAPAGSAAEELLRHRALQPRQLHLAGLRPGHAARYAGGLPVLRQVLGQRRHVRVAVDQPELRPDGLRAGPQRGGGLQRLRVPGERADAVQPARRGPRELEGLRPGSRQPR